MNRELLSLVESVGIIVVMLLSLALMTLVERKVMGVMQRRLGPDRVGWKGVLQPISDGLKLVVKENVVPAQASSEIYKIAPVVTLVLSILGWVVIPWNGVGIKGESEISIMMILAISSVSVYGIILTGWGGNSKYALLGSVRTTAQMISYEIVLSMVVLIVMVLVGEMPNFKRVVESQAVWNMWGLWPVAVIYLICALAETARAPFDLPEAESELVAGYVVENSGLSFAYYFLAEYLNIIMMSAIMVLLFMGGWGNGGIIGGTIMYALKLGVILFMFVWVRASYPRYRYDQLMTVAWKSQLPLTIGIILWVLGVVI